MVKKKEVKERNKEIETEWKLYQKKGEKIRLDPQVIILKSLYNMLKLEVVEKNYICIIPLIQ